MIPFLIREDITGKFYPDRASLDADRIKNRATVYPALEKMILENPMPKEALSKDRDEEDIRAQNIAVLRFKLKMDE